MTNHPYSSGLLLITTCTLVSFFHGSNDGQKGVGLLMLILIAFLPAKFAIDHSISSEKIIMMLDKADKAADGYLVTAPANKDAVELKGLIATAKGDAVSANAGSDATSFKIRKEVQAVNKKLKAMTGKDSHLEATYKETFISASHDLTKVTDFAPILGYRNHFYIIGYWYYDRLETYSGKLLVKKLVTNTLTMHKVQLLKL